MENFQRRIMNSPNERGFFVAARLVFLGLMAAHLVAGELPEFALAGGERASTPPNIILIMADDVSAKEFGCYGNTEHQTPVLDTLASTGVMFKTCWSAPICSPSRAMIMTGRYGFRTSWFSNYWKPGPDEEGGNLRTTNIIFTQPLKEAGYATAICGKWQLYGTEEEYGFDEHCMWEKYEGFDGPVEDNGRAARYWHPAIVKNNVPFPTTDDDYGPDIFVDFLLDFTERKKDEGPFFIYYPMCLPHKSWDFEAQCGGYLPVPELDENGNKTGNKVPGSLKSNVEYIDHLIDRIVKGLEAFNIRDNTVILFTGDNATAGYGKNLNGLNFERGSRVTMIVNGPGLVDPLGPVDALIDFSDVLPTICDLAGVTPTLPDGYIIDGHSFAPVLRGDNSREREWIFSFLGDRRMLRTKRWLLDGNNRFYDCGDNRNEVGYVDVTCSKDQEAVAARRRFLQILKDLPKPSEAQEAFKGGSTALPPPLPSIGDFDDDGDVDLEDFGYFQACLSGKGRQCIDGCEKADFNGDNDVDEEDYDWFISFISAADIPANLHCPH